MKNLIDNNPYRILDISIYSNSQAILDKQKYMLKLLKINEDFENNDLCSEIFQPKISESSINESVSELDNFRERLIYRLFWFDYNGKLFKNYIKEKTVTGISDIRDRHFLAVFSYEFIIGYIEKALIKHINIDTIIKEVNRFREKYGIDNFLDYWDILDEFDFQVYFKKIEKDNFSIYDISDEDYNDILLETASLILHNIEKVICDLINLFDMNLSIYLYKCVNDATFFDEAELDEFNNYINRNLCEAIIRNCESINNDINNLSDDTNKIREMCIHSYNFFKSKIIPVINSYKNFDLDRYDCLQYNNYISETLNIIAIKLYNKLNDFGTSLIILWDAVNIDIEDEELRTTIKNNISIIENNMILDAESMCVKFFQKIDVLCLENKNLDESLNEMSKYYFDTIKEKLNNLKVIRIRMEELNNLKNNVAIKLYNLSIDIYANKLNDYENAIKFLKVANLYAIEGSEIKTKIINNINILNSILEKEKEYLNINKKNIQNGNANDKYRIDIRKYFNLSNSPNTGSYDADIKSYFNKETVFIYAIILAVFIIIICSIKMNKGQQQNLSTQNTKNMTQSATQSKIDNTTQSTNDSTTQSTTQNVTQANSNNNSSIAKSALESSININNNKLKSMIAELDSIEKTIDDYSKQADEIKSRINTASNNDIYKYNDLIGKCTSYIIQYNNKYSEYKSLQIETNKMIYQYNSMK